MPRSALRLAGTSAAAAPAAVRPAPRSGRGIRSVRPPRSVDFARNVGPPSPHPLLSVPQWHRPTQRSRLPSCGQTPRSRSSWMRHQPARSRRDSRAPPWPAPRTSAPRRRPWRTPSTDFTLDGPPALFSLASRFESLVSRFEASACRRSSAFAGGGADIQIGHRPRLLIDRDLLLFGLLLRGLLRRPAAARRSDWPRPFARGGQARPHAARRAGGAVARAVPRPWPAPLSSGGTADACRSGIG